MVGTGATKAEVSRQNRKKHYDIKTMLREGRKKRKIFSRPTKKLAIPKKLRRRAGLEGGGTQKFKKRH